MTPEEYERFTASVRTCLEADARVLALVALGATAVPARRDGYSDHDFWVVVAPGSKAGFLEDLSWLPDGEERVAAIRIGSNGDIVLYSSGHIVEYVVSEPEDLAQGKLDAYSVLFDRGGIQDRLEEIAGRSSFRSTRLDNRPQTEVLLLLVMLLTGARRAARGEHLSAHKYIAYFALDWLLGLLIDREPMADPTLIDRLDPWRRFDQIHPALAGELLAAVQLPTIEAAMRLLDIGERELRGVLPEYPERAAGVVRSELRRLLGAVGADDVGGQAGL
jgi:hypothetical protein